MEKHFDGDFTSDQEKEITFKRWPPGVPKLKTWLGTQRVKIHQLARNGRRVTYLWRVRKTSELKLNPTSSKSVLNERKKKTENAKR